MKTADGSGTTVVHHHNKHVGDKYQVGQAGAVGRDAKAENVNFQQVWNSGGFDSDALATELATLRKHLKSSGDSADTDVQVGVLAQAEQAAGAGDGPQAVSILARVSTPVLQTARDIGVAVAAAVIAKAIGIS